MAASGGGHGVRRPSPQLFALPTLWGAGIRKLLKLFFHYNSMLLELHVYFLCLSLVNYSLVSALFSLSPIIMSKHQGPTHSFFSKRPRVATGSSDAINDFQVAIVDPKSVPNDISKTAREGSTQVELLKYPVDTNERRFRKEWFKDSVWLEYSQTRDSALCYACRHFGLGNVRSAWCTTGFSNWKKAVEKFSGHNCSETHNHAVAAWMQWKLDDTRNVTAMLSDLNETIKKENRHYIGAVVDVVSLCCRQAIALRGHRESDEEPSHVNKGNFLAILDLVARHDPIVARRLQEGPQNAKYTHHSIQDNVIHAAAELIREQIAAETNGNYYAIIADESRDTGHKVQMSLVLRYVVQEDGIHGKNVIKESLLGFAACGSLSAAGLCETLLTSLRDCRIDLLGCVAQCFDGAAVMSGRCTGVQSRIRELCPKAIYVHCFAHRLNLVIVDCCARYS